MAKQKNTYRRRTREIEEEVTVEMEQIDGYVDVKLPRKAQFNNGGFITVFQSAIYNIATKADLTKGEMKLLLYLLGTAGVNNSILVDNHILCKELNEKRPNIYKAIKGLTDRNIVIKKDYQRGTANNGSKAVPMEFRINYDQINYDLAYNGKINQYKNKQYTHPELLPVPVKEIEQAKQITLLESIEEIKAEQKKENP